MPFQVGQRVGDYEVVHMLGAGGMGHVYRVRNIISNRTEAMKVLLPDLTAEPDLAMRFISEIRTLAGFDHPNIAQLRTALQADNQLVMVMEYVEGYTLEQLAKQRSLPISEVAGYVSQTLSALAYAHERGVIHRDIKPANLMVTSHGIIKLMDFGIAKSTGENDNHTKPGMTMGSLYYMSPEQVRGTGVDPRSDIYSVGVVLYELLAGRKPFEADTTFSILNQQLNVMPQPPMEINPSLAPPLNAVILRALAKDPAQRFQNAEEFRAALRPFCTAPNGQEVMPPIAMGTATPPAAFQPSAAASQPAAMTQPSASAAQAAPPQPVAAYANVPYAGPMPPQQRAGGKAIWIATGAVAVVLALAGVGFALPHMLYTHAAGSAAAQPDASATTTAVTVTPTATPETGIITPATTTAASVPNVASPATSPNSTPLEPRSTMHPATARSSGPQPAAPGNNAAGMNSTPSNAAPANAPSGNAPPANSAALDEANERMIGINARAQSAKRGVAQIRSQQEASGLGMRGDIESAESRLDAYMQAAGNDLARGNASGASHNLDKADTELAILEKFLGR